MNARTLVRTHPGLFRNPCPYPGRTSLSKVHSPHSWAAGVQGCCRGACMYVHRWVRKSYPKLRPGDWKTCAFRHSHIQEYHCTFFIPFLPSTSQYPREVLKYSISRAEEIWGNCCGPHWNMGLGTWDIHLDTSWVCLPFPLVCSPSRQPNTYIFQSLDASFLLDHFFLNFIIILF